MGEDASIGQGKNYYSGWIFVLGALSFLFLVEGKQNHQELKYLYLGGSLKHAVYEFQFIFKSYQSGASLSFLVVFFFSCDASLYIFYFF